MQINGWVLAAVIWLYLVQFPIQTLAGVPLIETHAVFNNLNFGWILIYFFNCRFCCMRCFEDAMKSYHRIESKIDVNQLFYNDDVGTTQMSGCLSLAYRQSIYIRTVRF